MPAPVADSGRDLSRRTFQQLTSAALGGLLAAGLPGCSGGGGTPPATGEAGSQEGGTASSRPPADIAHMLAEPHVCRGLNTCKGLGVSKQNACAGQGTCATVVHHDCAGKNECKGQGGCGGQEGMNGCKGHGYCAVPLEHSWDKVRQRFEEAMQKAGREVGPAPDAA